ncbi:unannotated protein [freshwater metagenome]|uniref:Unannotated protein n=1 Tax=freshwater metagenome TaxID=449393 RepID=A0A6J7I182_9ZZZZ|nr:hypothetical protein [Actinomycetota bacterium]
MLMNRHLRRGMPPLALILAVLGTTIAASSAHAMPTVKPDDHGAGVRVVQRALGLAPDGLYGKGTKKAIRRFQRQHELKADGVVGPATWNMLRRAGRLGSTIHRSSGRSRGTAAPQASVRRLQAALGIDADGVFGPGTESAVKEFQRTHSLTPDGVVGPATWQALGLGDGLPVLKRAGAAGPAGPPQEITSAIAAANRIAHKPYIWGGGHGSFEAAGYDCSGSVSYVLHAAGLLSKPMASGEFTGWGKSGPGRWITIYANGGHMFMTIRTPNGLMRYDTSGMDDGSRWDGDLRPASGYVVRHPHGF